ncbi:MAG: hypothetical protein ABI689_00170 [Thermoanaerobaculia bacterium]
MKRSFRKLSPPLLLATGVIVAAALRLAAPHEAWSVLAAPFVLVLALVAADLLQAHLGSGPMRVSSGALLVGVAILVASAAIAAQGLAHLGSWIPIFGGCAAAPLFLRHGEGPRCSLD